jgi:8-oxo-dGTP diphosphatase
MSRSSSAKYDDLHRISITAIVYKEEGGGRKYLITRRSLEKKAYPGKWTVPGGGLETRDYINLPPTHGDGQWYNTVEKTLKREVREEVGLEIDDVRYLLDLVFIRPDGVPVLVLSYYCRSVSGKVRLDKDNIEYAWVTAEEVQRYDLIEGIKEEILMVEQKLSV